MSTKLGTFFRRQSPPQSIEPAINTNAEFLAPLIVTSPFKGLRPHISRTGWGSLAVAEVLVGLVIELMVLSSRI